MSLTFHFPYCFRPLYTSPFANAQLNQCKMKLLGKDCLQMFWIRHYMQISEVCVYLWLQQKKTGITRTLPPTVPWFWVGSNLPLTASPQDTTVLGSWGPAPRESPCLALPAPVLPCPLYPFQTGHHPCAPLPFSHFQPSSSLPTN